MISNDHLSGVPLLVLANKQDLPDCMGVREIKPVFQHSGSHIGRRECLVMPVSALTKEGVDEGIRWLTEGVKHNSIIRKPRGVNDWCKWRSENTFLCCYLTNDDLDPTTVIKYFFKSSEIKFLAILHRLVLQTFVLLMHCKLAA